MIDLIPRVEEIYRRADAATTRLADVTGLQCPTGCGRCCHSPHVESTLLECLPLAFASHRDGSASALWEQLRTTTSPRCILFQPDPIQPEENGRCGAYSHRPLLCRLFGFAATRDKYGQAHLAACRIHQQVAPGPITSARTWVSSHTDEKTFDQWSREIESLEPELGTRRLPINQALLAALEWVGLRIHLAGLSHPDAIPLHADTGKMSDDNNSPSDSPNDSTTCARMPRSSAT